MHRRSLHSIEPRPVCVSLCLCVCRGTLIRAKQHLMIMRLGEERKDPGMQRAWSTNRLTESPASLSLCPWQFASIRQFVDLKLTMLGDLAHTSNGGDITDAMCENPGNTENPDGVKKVCCDLGNAGDPDYEFAYCPV